MADKRPKDPGASATAAAAPEDDAALFVRREHSPAIVLASVMARAERRTIAQSHEHPGTELQLSDQGARALVRDAPRHCCAERWPPRS